MTDLLDHLARAAAGGRKLLAPYLIGGVPDPDAFPAAFAAVCDHADVVEVGLPFSDPLMDGPVIAAAGERAIAAGVGPLDALELEFPGTTPRVAMTYYNPIHRSGEVEFCGRAAKAGFQGLIVPDLPLEESGSLRAAAAAEGLGWVPLVSPTTPSDRVARIAETCTGFVYAVSTLGVTGVRESLSERARVVVSRCRAATDLPVLVGIGVSTPEQAVEAATESDGVVIGSAVVSRVIERGPDAAREFLGQVRAALDAAG